MTGISTGALLAPLVFLGDDLAAKQLYTAITGDDIYRPRSALELQFANSLTDTAPLRDKVQSIVTDDFVARIADEGRSGRVLAIQAVDLENNLLLVRGAVPGPKGALILVRTAAKKKGGVK